MMKHTATTMVLLPLGLLWALATIAFVARLFSDPVGDACGVNNGVGFFTGVLMAVTAAALLRAGYVIERRDRDDG